jgi:hypothetical protein
LRKLERRVPAGLSPAGIRRPAIRESIGILGENTRPFEERSRSSEETAGDSGRYRARPDNVRHPPSGNELLGYRSGAPSELRPVLQKKISRRWPETSLFDDHSG